MNLNNMSDHDKQKFRNMVKEAVGSKFRTDAESTLRKEIGDRCKEELGIDKKVFNKVVNVSYKDDLENMQNEMEDIESLYHIVENDDDDDDQ